MLLVLDNFEQVLPAATLVAELLAAAPRLKVLVTSRAVLHVSSEQEFPVPPLTIPGVQAFRGSGVQEGPPERRPPNPPNFGGAWGGTPERLMQYAAVELFIQRAVAVNPEFRITNENAPAVAEICYRLDGLPLAIELAAARTKLLSPQAMLSRLVGSGLAPAPGGRSLSLPRTGSGNPGSRLRLLTGGARDLPARQQTLRGAIAWGYDLLEESEKTLFRRLSVFVGGCTLEAAEAVCNAANDLELDVLDGIAELSDKSLLRQDETTSGEVRFGMLATIQEYALECLAASGEAEALRQQHAQFFLELAEANGGDPQLEAEHDNLRAALSWYLDSGNAEHALRLATALWHMWYFRGYWSEGRGWLERALAPAQILGRTRERALALRTTGRFAWAQGDFTGARTLLEESLAILRERNAVEDLPSVLNALGELTKDQGDYDAARRLFEESLAILREQGEKSGIAWALQALGQVAQQQGDETAKALFEESLALFQEIGDQSGRSFSLFHLGEVAQAQGDLGKARSLHEQSLAIQREVGYKAGIARSLSSLGTIAAAQRNYEAARSLYEECLTLRRELGEKRGIAACLEGLGRVAGGQGQPERTARLFGAAQALRDRIGAPLSPSNAAAYEEAVAAARAALNREAFAAAWAEGHSMLLEQAITYALESGG
jgi:predicted ATPase